MQPLSIIQQLFSIPQPLIFAIDHTVIWVAIIAEWQCVTPTTMAVAPFLSVAVICHGMVGPAPAEYDSLPSAITDNWPFFPLCKSPQYRVAEEVVSIHIQLLFPVRTQL